MEYYSWKLVHVGAVTLSVTGFVARAVAVQQGASWTKARWVRVLPHLIDTVLLGSAIMLALTIQQYPLKDAWLTAKLIGLVGYVYFGAKALRGGTAGIRRAAFAMALACVAYIVSVALTRQVLPGLWP